MTTEELLERVLGKLEEKMIPLEVQLWDTERISAYLHREYKTVRDTILVLPSFPKPIRVGKEGRRPHPLYLAREVIAWAESQQSKT